MKPNRFKILLCLLFLILISMIAVSFISQSNIFFNSNLGFLLESILIVLALLSFILILSVSYLLGALIDYFISDKRIKYVIAAFLGLAAIISIYITYKILAEPVICDPVHVPNQTVICDPVHDPSQTESYNLDVLENIKIDENTVKDSYSQCLQNLNN